MMATQSQHQDLAGIINLLINARQRRVQDDLTRKMNGAAEAQLHNLFQSDQVDELMTAWEYSRALNPLELPAWRAILDPE